MYGHEAGAKKPRNGVPGLLLGLLPVRSGCLAALGVQLLMRLVSSVTWL